MTVPRGDVDYSRLNIVGCGRLAKAVGKLFLDARVVREIHVCNRSLVSGEEAVAVVGTGVAYSSVKEMPQSSLWLIGSGDQEIPEVVRLLAEDALFETPSVVFHCSGAIPSTELAPLRERGCGVASVHPVRSFANTEMAVRDFRGTLCAAEGDESALRIVGSLFSDIGGEVFTVPTEAKLLCHAGHVFASNYLVSLLKVAHDLYAAAGIPEELSWRIMEPLVRGTVDNVMRLGPTRALTGPVARGEGPLIAKQLDEVRKISLPLSDLYARLGCIAVDIAREQGVSEERIQSVRAALISAESE